MKTGRLPSVHIFPADSIPSGWPHEPQAGWTASVPPLTVTLVEGETESLSRLRVAVETVARDRSADEALPLHLEAGPPVRLTATFDDLERVAAELDDAAPPGPAVAGAIRAAAPHPPSPPPIATSRGELRFDGPPLLMGVLNVTPDSFSDGGLYLEADAACRRAWELIGHGAAIIDLGAESTRPGADPVSADEELRRLRPVLSRLAPACPVPISVDTYKAEVAEVALNEGADLINDISGLTFDPSLPAVAARHGAPVILGHIRGRPKTMQQDPQYRWIVPDVIEELAASVRTVTEAGLPMERCLIDPGLGFGKSLAHNDQLIEAIPTLRQLGLPVVVGPSRKAFIRARWGARPGRLAEGTAAVCSRAAALGASVLRVHDVGAVRQALALAADGPPPERPRVI